MTTSDPSRSLKPFYTQELKRLEGYLTEFNDPDKYLRELSKLLGGVDWQYKDGVLAPFILRTMDVQLALYYSTVEDIKPDDAQI